MKKIFAYALTALATGANFAFAAKTPRPNVIIILADDLGYADIGVQGIEKDVLTPNIDSIAHDGVRFTQGYVSCPVCSPSRAGILTGRYQERFGHEWNPLPGYDMKFGLSRDQTTIANEFKRIGYATGALGKWHEGNTSGYYPTQRGFDEFFGFWGGMHGYLNMRTPAKQGWNCIRRGDDPYYEKDYLTDAISREAVSFIDRHADQPFFLYCAYNAVHVPQQSPKKYLDRFADVQDHKRKWMLAMLSAEDDGVGKILDELRAKKLDGNTLVVFLSDNGGPTSEDGSRNTPLRGFKGQVWEGGIRVPFMARWPGHIPAGRTIDRPVVSLDLFPTTLAAAGAKPKDGLKLDGRNILPLMEGKSDKGVHPILYWRFEPQWAIRDGDYKLETARDGITRLYNLKEDVSERNDLMSSNPKIAKKLHAEFDAWNTQLMAPKWPGRQEGANDAARADYEESLAEAD
ncbi:MAG TPA: sulfatase [Tepidisphaeraceae bacterium]|jgi:arylsulfatase A-like enzyme